MKKKNIKMLIIIATAFAMAIIFSTTCYAKFDNMKHHDPTGSTWEHYAYPASECNRTINVTFIDQYGGFIGKGILHTKYGCNDSFHIGMGGYDIIKFESNQGLWETCKIAWTSGTGTGDEAELYVEYYFRTRLSKDELNITVTMRKWDPIKFEVRHYVEDHQANGFSRNNYKLHSITNQQTLDYYDYFSVSAKNIYGYTLNPQYETKISANLCLQELLGKYANTPSWPRYYNYDLHHTEWGKGMECYSSYDETKDGKLDWCDNRRVVIEFFYDIKEYTIKFNANGGQGAPAEVKKYHNQDIDLPIEIPTRQGCTFVGWGTYASDTTPNYQPGGKYTANSGRTLYAIWTQNASESYTVSYNANGGYNTPENQKKYFDQPLELSEIIPIRQGYTFEGWGTYASDTTPNYQPGEIYFDNEPLSLYAIWTETVNNYIIQFNANGGMNPPEPIFKTHGIPIRLPYEEPTRNGYTFKGWSEDRYASYPAFFAGGEYPVNKNATLYAVWSKNSLPTYTIKFDANGGINPPTNLMKIQDSAVYIPYQAPTRTQYEFLGWSEGKFANLPSYEAGDAYTRNASTTLYAVWRYNPATYRIWFEKNGGTGGPDVLSKNHGENITIPTNTPIKTGYHFVGWSERSNSNYVRYHAGDIYSENRTIHLYAVWEKANYDFSVNSLSVTNTNPFRYEQVDVSFRAFNMDNKKGYEHIPVDLYFGGNLIKTQYVNFQRYGYADITFALNVGDAIGQKDIEVRVNWDKRFEEINSNNNSAKTNITVKDYDYEISVEPVNPTTGYMEGMTVISSFLVRNDSDRDILPSSGNTVLFRPYYFNSAGQKIVISTHKWKEFVVPKHAANLVYFKWDVPYNLAGKTVYMECIVNYDHSFQEQNESNNITTYSNTVIAKSNSQTPDTRYESQKPPHYHYSNAPSEQNAQATWSVWKYESGKFVLKKYGVELNTAKPMIMPSENCLSSKFENGCFTMKSGYGITVNYKPTLNAPSGYLMPNSYAYTEAQQVNMFLPEYVYRNNNGYYRTLENVGGEYMFVKNSNATKIAREHFIPLYVEDGKYIVSTEVTQIWTPAGMVTGRLNSNTININGTIYDDWYQN